MKKDKKKDLPAADAERSLSPDMRFACRLYRFHRFYWSLVAIAGVVCMTAVFLAVVANVLVGLCMAVIVAVLYHHFKKLALSRILGITCTAAERGLCIQSATAWGEETLYLPTHLMGMRICALGETALSCEGNEALTTICFFGSREEWERIAHSCDLADLTVECDVALPNLSTLVDAPTAEQETEGDA